MPYSIKTRDGAVYMVDDVDLHLITAYLTLEGCPPVSVEPMSPNPLHSDLLGTEDDSRRGRQDEADT